MCVSDDTGDVSFTNFHTGNIVYWQRKSGRKTDINKLHKLLDNMSLSLHKPVCLSCPNDHAHLQNVRLFWLQSMLRQQFSVKTVRQESPYYTQLTKLNYVQNTNWTQRFRARHCSMCGFAIFYSQKSFLKQYLMSGPKIVEITYAMCQGLSKRKLCKEYVGRKDKRVRIKICIGNHTISSSIWN